MASSKIHKLLIANRGEIACRIIKTAKQMGITCVAVYSDIDRQALHVKMADEAYCIGPAPAKSSYLLAEKIIQTAKLCHANAIHPGYGFLSENAEFAKSCIQNNIIFVGPPVTAIEAMGSKSRAKEIMEGANIPLVPGYHGANQDPSMLLTQANEIGFPLLIKAVAGGGGKGMRIVEKAEDFIAMLAACQRESLASFADDRVLLEKYITRPRHIEIQIFADNFNNLVHCFERDCSLQRRHQKVLEEAPAPNFSAQLRLKMGQVAIDAASAIGYQGAGTIEFLLDADGQFYFMEMNTRLQVEHPITEMITGIDLVEWQLMVAMGQTLPLSQDEITLSGHAFEARVYAEDPNNDFLPSSGLINDLRVPECNAFVRIDSGFTRGDEISVFYDPMIAKLIVWDKNRNAALTKLSNALKQFHVAGPATNLEFLYQLSRHQKIVDGNYNTHFIQDHLDEVCIKNDYLDHPLIFAAALIWMDQQFSDAHKRVQELDPYSPWNMTNAWQINTSSSFQLQLGYQKQLLDLTLYFEPEGYVFEYQQQDYKVCYQCQSQHLELTIDGHISRFDFFIKGTEIVIFKQGSRYKIEVVQRKTDADADEINQHTSIKAPMPGTLIQISVKPGDILSKGQNLMLIEAMKMEHQIKAHKAIKITALCVQPGDLIDETTRLVEFEEL